MQSLSIVLIIAVFFLLSFSLLFLLDKRSNRRQMIQYVDVMTGTDDVLTSLSEAQEIFSRHSAAHLAINEAVYYLENSILKDYETAFTIIECCFGQVEVKRMHEAIIENEKSKIVYLLTS